MKKMLIGLIPALAVAVAVVWMAPSVAGAASGYYGPDGYYNELAYVDDHGREIYVDHRGRYFFTDYRGNCHFVPAPHARVAPRVYYPPAYHHYPRHNPGLLGYLLGY